MRACSILRRRLDHSAIPSRRAQIASPSGAQSRSPLTRAYSTRTESREASSFWFTFTLISVSGGAWLYNRYSVPDLPPTHLPPPPQEPFLGVIDTLQTMPTEPAPGTIGTLTPDQEVKLQEFWVLALKVFGVKLDTLELDQASGSGNASGSSTKKSASKSRWSLWGSSTDDDKEDAKSTSSASGIASSLASISITDGDDKYGQSKEFQQALVDLSPEEIRTAFWNMVKQDNPDSLVLRFLRARKWDVKKALIMFISTMRWRLQDMHVDDDIMANGEALASKQEQGAQGAEKKKGEEFLTQLRMGKSFLHGVDKFGRPICVVRVRLHRASEQEPETLERYTVYTIETARLLLAPPVETATIIFDMTDFSLANMDYTPVKFMIKCFEANYPESLGSVLIHKAPWVFSSIWSIIKGWLDPVVAAKIHFTKNRTDLEQFIAPGQIMKELEGDENWEYKYAEPQPGENTKMEDKETRDALLAERQKLAQEIQESTIEWIRTSFKKETEAASAAKEKRNGQIDQLRNQYWQLDPYVRARSLYDRLEMIKGDGKIEFYPEALKKANAAQ